MATQVESTTKEYVRPMPATWWLKNPAYTRFMLRDITSVFLAGYAVFLIVLLYRAGQSEAAFRAFYDSLRSPLSVVLHVIALAFAAYHSYTFFNLTPRVIVVHRGDEKVPEHYISGGHYTLWIVASLVLLLIALW